jgi:hypothetical protein
VNTQLPNVVPFGLSSAAQFRVPPPPSLSGSTWKRDYNEVMAVGRSDSTVRTADQSKAVLFWREQAQFTWNTIARNVAPARSSTTTSSRRATATAKAMTTTTMEVD